MATHSSTLAWRIPGTEEPGGLPSIGSHRVGHDWSNLAAAAATGQYPSGGDGIPADLFKILKGSVVKVLHSICQQIWETQQWPQDWKRPSSLQSWRKAMPKHAQTTVELCSFYMQARLCSKSFKRGFNNMWTKNFKMYKLDLEMSEEPEIKMPTSAWSQKKQENSRKHLLMLHWPH